MGLSTIEWTDYTHNPWRGCTKVSDACKNCYAETMSKRNPGTLGVWGDNGTRVIASESYWKQPHKWNREAAAADERRRVFCASMADVFEDREELHIHRSRLWTLIDATPNLDWLLLTKRPENISRMYPIIWLTNPPNNVWLGTTVENQAMANKRIPELLKIPANVRFLSCEPLLESIDLIQAMDVAIVINDLIEVPAVSPSVFLNWVIAGSESGSNARHYDLDWFRSLRDQCADAEIPFFMKQLTDSKGRRIPFEEWPEDLQVREYPNAKEGA